MIETYGEPRLRGDTVQTVVLSWGEPKSGTTLVRNMLMTGRGYYTHRIREGYPWHPRNAPQGLGRIVQFHEGKNVVLVRTVRHPADVIEGQCLIDPKRVEDLDDRILAYRQESENTRVGWEEIRAGKWNAPYYPTRVALVTMHYGWFQDGGKRWEFLSHLTSELPERMANRAAFGRYLEETWVRRPVRDGHLSRGQRGMRNERVLSEEQVEKICAELLDVLVAENIEHSSIIESLEAER